MTYTLLAESLRYPAPGHLESLECALPQIEAQARPGYAGFLRDIQQLSLSEWEELYTRTWDLNPPAAPYVGYQTWGDNYPRGNFMARFNRLLHETGIDSQGELPDHLIPVLRYLGAVAEPLPELLEILPAALERISAALRKADPANPYLHLLESVQAYHRQQEARKTA